MLRLGFAVFLGFLPLARASLDCTGVESTGRIRGKVERAEPGRTFRLTRGAARDVGTTPPVRVQFVGVDEDLRCNAPPAGSCAVDGAAVVRVRVSCELDKRDVCFRFSNHPDDPRIHEPVYRNHGLRVELVSLSKNGRKVELRVEPEIAK